MYVLAMKDKDETSYLTANRWGYLGVEVRKHYNPYDPSIKDCKLIRFVNKEVALITVGALIASALKRGFFDLMAELTKLEPIEEPTFKKESWW